MTNAPLGDAAVCRHLVLIRGAHYQLDAMKTFFVVAVSLLLLQGETFA
jgi:hypothetical protein